MKEFKVTWTIEVDARTAEDAARKARAIQIDPESTATIFEVHTELPPRTRDGDTRYMVEEYDTADLPPVKKKIVRTGEFR